MGRKAPALMSGLVLTLLLQGHALRRYTLREDPSTARLSFHNQSIRAETQHWATLNVYEQNDLLQGSHYDVTLPEVGYYIGYTPPLQRLGLPALKMQDGSSGFRTTEPDSEGTTTIWPCLLALASTWDEDLVGKVAEELGGEFKGKGANVMIGPSIGVLRTASFGRSFEAISGDDPYLGSRLVKAFIRGVQSKGVMCAVKQLAFSDQETNRKQYNAVVDQRTAWELYYPTLEAAIQAGVGAVLCGYNKVNETFACHNPDLLKRDLRENMGFQGMVISQWGGARGIDAMENGVDVEMPGRNKVGPGKFTLQQMVTVDAQIVQDATVNVRKAIYSVGLDKDTNSCNPPDCKGQLYSNQRSPQRTALARDAAVKAVTLLKNEDNILPLDVNKIRKLALVGSASFKTGAGKLLNADYYSGGGSSHVNSRVGMLQTPWMVLYERLKWMGNMKILSIPGSPSNTEAIRKLHMLADADAIVVVGACTAAETVDRFNLAMDDYANDLIGAVGLLGKPTVVLMMTPGAVTTPWRDLPHVKAIANIFLGGEGSSRAMAGLLFGDFNPSGKLPITFPASEYDVLYPSFNLQVNYTEGLFTSYRNSKMKVAYPFGHGLSFTNFSISSPRQMSTNCTALACIKVRVQNIGQRAGAEVPQCYVEFAPELREPKLLLKGFKRVHLKVGESKDVIFNFTERDFSVYRPGTGWVLQRVVRVHVGNSSAMLGDPVILRIKRESSQPVQNQTQPLSQPQTQNQTQPPSQLQAEQPKAEPTAQPQQLATPMEPQQSSTPQPLQEPTPQLKPESPQEQAKPQPEQEKPKQQPEQPAPQAEAAPQQAQPGAATSAELQREQPQAQPEPPAPEAKAEAHQEQPKPPSEQPAPQAKAEPQQQQQGEPSLQARAEPLQEQPKPQAAKPEPLQEQAKPQPQQAPQSPAGSPQQQQQQQNKPLPEQAPQPKTEPQQEQPAPEQAGAPQATAEPQREQPTPQV